MYSEKDLQDAAAFRAQIYKEALTVLKTIEPDVCEVVDRYPIEAYFQQKWDYPGAWYTVVTIPQGVESREALVDLIVRDTLSRYRQANKKENPLKRTLFGRKRNK